MTSGAGGLVGESNGEGSKHAKYFILLRLVHPFYTALSLYSLRRSLFMCMPAHACVFERDIKQIRVFTCN